MPHDNNLRKCIEMMNYKILEVNLVEDDDNLYLIDNGAVVTQYQLSLTCNLPNRIDVPTWPIGRDVTNTSNYYFGTDGTLCHQFFKADNAQENLFGKKRKWFAQPVAIHKLAGIWTMAILVSSKKRKDVLMSMTVDRANEFVPPGYKVVYVSNDVSYSGGYWTIITEEDYSKYKEYLTIKEMSVY
jgi:hypothetical protein